MHKKIEPYPSTGKKDVGREITDALIASIPVVGSPLQIVLSSIIEPSLERRREHWFNTLVAAIDEIQRLLKDLELSDLSKNDAFVNGVIDATRIAFGTHLDEKIDLLKACLVNLGLGKSNGDFLDRQMFRWIDILSPEHFLILAYLESPHDWFRSHQITEPQISMGSPIHLLNQANLEIPEQVLQIALNDLSINKLARTDSMNVTMTGDGVWQSMLTPIGNQLVDFVRVV